MPARKTASATVSPKPRATKPKAAAVSDGDDRKVLHFEPGVRRGDERIPLFEVGAAEFTMPKVVPAGWSLRLLRDIRASGDLAAGMNLIERLCGPAALEAAMDADLTLPQWNQLINIASDHVLGQLETSQKN